MAQSLSHLFVHLVFSTKNRQPFITQEIEARLFGYFAKVLHDECKSPAEIVGGFDDHIHILLNLSRMWSVSDVVKVAKKQTSKWMKTQGEEFADFFWQSGFGAFSVSCSNVPVVRKYIADQRRHHQKLSFKEELIYLLEKHDVRYDERYLWD